MFPPDGQPAGDLPILTGDVATWAGTPVRERHSLISEQDPFDTPYGDDDCFGWHPGETQPHEPWFSDPTGRAGGQVYVGLLEDSPPQRVLRFPARFIEEGATVNQDKESGLAGEVGNGAGLKR